MSQARLGDLHPTENCELSWPYFKDCTRYQGSHFLRLRRPSKTPESSRPYRPGDPISLIDWKGYARSDQLLIRQHRDFASAKVLLVVDTSQPMLWPTAHKDGSSDRVIPKVETALRIAFHLLYLHFRRGDFAHLWFANEEHADRPGFLLRPTTSAQILTMFNHLRESNFALASVQAELRHELFEPVDYDLSYWVSDCLSHLPWERFLVLGRQKNLLQVLAQAELDVSWLNHSSCYFDQSMQLKEYQGQVLLSQDSYYKGVDAWLASVREKTLAMSSEYLVVTEQTSVVTYMRHLTGK